ncbi:TRAP transporter small permease [Paracoccus tegillarcae]|uniref:TRAP transporter small permease protein n=1 Tax=Paracoccus tegillarcae TaxID=1529068 RepID=A0A2K9ELN0_9RHOB|nr:TRAP transporter small permease [Paracoccus tegillarcae]AUH34337.1 TRAP transporter small permease [Paracoccus tegillarcae]
MQDRMKSIAEATGLLARAALWLAGIGLVLMTALIAAQVFWRYILNDSIIWTEPASVMIMGWFIFLGAAVGIREGYHLSFDVLLYVLPDTVKKILHSVSDLAVGGFGVGMIWYGWQLAAKTAGNTLPSLGISGAFDFAPIIGGGALVVLFSIERILRRAAGLHTARFGEEPLEDG